MRVEQMALGNLAIAALLIFGVGCVSGRNSPAGFRLPENGDVERGLAAFTRLECYSCHRVSGGGVPAATSPDIMTVPLGGEVLEVRTDGYLVTSIIHPSHRIRGANREKGAVAGESRMPDYSDAMTVRELVDIIAFLQSRYRIAPLHP